MPSALCPFSDATPQIPWRQPLDCPDHIATCAPGQTRIRATLDDLAPPQPRPHDSSSIPRQRHRPVSKLTREDSQLPTVDAHQASLEQQALTDTASFVMPAAVLTTPATLAHRRSSTLATPPESKLRFDEEDTPPVFALDLHRDGTPPRV